jgi:3-oxoacyl-[acyl-carrier protein] reductase
MAPRRLGKVIWRTRKRRRINHMADALKGKVAVVTGSGQGIGRAIAIGLAMEGAKVVTNNRRRGSTGNAIVKESQVNALGERKEWFQKGTREIAGDAETTAEAIKDLGGEALPFFGDIADFGVAAGLIRTTIEAFGKIDILVNVAGTFGFSPVWEITEELWDHVTSTKPKGYFNAIRHAVPHMIKQKWGRIINWTSRAFLGDVLKHAEYCAANAGVVGLTYAVAKELYPYGITCNAFSPYAKTRADYELKAFDMVSSKEESPWMDRKFAGPSDREAPGPEHIAPFVAYLASDGAEKISGSVFSIAGNSIGLYSEPAIARSLVKFDSRPWTVGEIEKQAPLALFMDYKSPADLG